MNLRFKLSPLISKLSIVPPMLSRIQLCTGSGIAINGIEKAA